MIGAIVVGLAAGSREGVGVMILNAAQFYNSCPPALYVAMLAAGLAGVAFYALVALAERLALGPLRVGARKPCPRHTHCSQGGRPSLRPSPTRL